MEKQDEKIIRYVPEVFTEFTPEELRASLKQMRQDLKEAIEADSEYTGEMDLLISSIDNLQESLVGVKNLVNLDMRKQARIYADMTLITMFLEDITETDNDDEFDFDEDEDF